MAAYERVTMNIQHFEDVHVITHGHIPIDSKFKEFDFCIPKCNDDGLFIELGVWHAKSLNYMAGLKPEKQFYGFDTFEGVDEIWETGVKTVDMNWFTMRNKELIDPDTGLPAVRDNITLIKGMFQDTLNDWLDNHPDNISFINMDPDIYSAAIYALETLNDRIIPGTIIRFDEISCWRTLGYHGYDKDQHASISAYTTWEEGEWKALNEWLSKYDREVEPFWRNWHQSGGVRVVK